MSIDWGRLHHEKKLLKKAGYIVYEEKPWHWEVTKEGSRILVHVWPTTGKYMVSFDSGANFYENDIVGAINRCFNPDLKMELSAEQHEKMKEVQEFRNTFFNDIQI